MLGQCLILCGAWTQGLQITQVDCDWDFLELLVCRMNPVLSFLVFKFCFGTRQGKPAKNKNFNPYSNPTIPGNEGKILKKKEFLAGVKTRISSQARKKSTKINLLGPETARWGGGLPREGVVAEKLVLSLESLSSLGFEGRNLGCPEIFAGMSRILGGVQKVCAKKVRAHFAFPIQKKKTRKGRTGQLTR